jgi:hypothetical protein
MRKQFFVLMALLAILFAACKKETDTDFKINPAIADYAPYEVGKFITYQVDSFRYLPFSLNGITIRYQVKYAVDAAITDNLGRPAFRIFRYIRKNATDAWVQDNTFFAVNTGERLEFNENNMRFIKLSLPVVNEFSWKGNSFINTTGPATEVRYLDDWDYVYDSVGTSITLAGTTISDVIKVDQRDEVIGNPADANAYSEINYGVEYYAKGIGMVYRRFLHSEYQPPAGGGSSGYYSDATRGVTFVMIDHN